MAKLERESHAYWATLPEERKEVVVDLITQVLGKLLEDPVAWIPGSFEPNDSDWITVNIRMQMPDLDERMFQMEVEDRARHRAALQDLQDIEESLR